MSEYIFGLDMEQGRQVYICVHNPMRDLSIIEVRELVNKADIDVTLVLVLPPGDLLDKALARADSTGQQLLHQDGFVSSLADMAAWLQTLTSGIFRHVWLVVPYMNRQTFAESNLRALLDTFEEARLLRGP